jgi:serine/threonine protein kinase
VSAAEPEQHAASPTARLGHLPPRFCELLERVRASETGQGEPVYVDKYKIIRLLGTGGFGMVLLADHHSLGRWVALKLCPAEVRDLVGLEAMMLALFSHPNIVSVYDVGTHDVGTHESDVFYVMEYIPGCDGGKYIKQWRNWRDVIAVYEHAATGLAVAHKRGIVHGDIKPENVLIGVDDRVCVADFGLARLIDAQPEDADARVSHRLGTLPYMAPECLQGKRATPASDQWALCVALWETLYYSRPFKGATIAALLDSIERGLPRPLGLIPWSVQAVLRRGLSIDPADRYPDMQALIDALRQACSRSTAGEVAPSKRRNWFAAALAATCGALLGAYGWAHRPQPIDPAPEHESPETEPAPEPEPAPEFSASPCVLDGRNPTELDPELIAACRHIRNNAFESATTLWTQRRKARLTEIDDRVRTEQINGDDLRAAVIADTEIIARTFEDQAGRLKASDSTLAALAYSFAQYWRNLPLDGQEGR